MKYRAIRTEEHDMGYNLRDKDAGIIGEFTKIEDEKILFSGESKTEMELKIKAYYYDKPNRLIYLCDEKNRIHGIFLHQGEEEAKVKYEEQKWLTYCLSFIFFLNLAIGAGIGFTKTDNSILTIFGIITALILLYLGIIKLKFMNYIESTVLAAILSILSWIIAANMM